MTYVPEAQRETYRTLLELLTTATGDLLTATRELQTFIHGIQDEQQSTDLYSHYAFRPEVVAETAVHLSDDMPWDEIAHWCGGTLRTAQDPSGEYESFIVLPSEEVAASGTWIVLRHDGTFTVRHSIEEPSALSILDVEIGVLQRVCDRDASESLDVELGRLRLKRDNLILRTLRRE